KQRRVLVQAKVVLTKGPLEGLLTRTGKKEHEYILASDLDARHLHTALELAGAKAGKPVQFRPKYTPASGSTVAIRLRYEQEGKAVELSAREWIVEAKTGKALTSDWVFGGSKLVPHPEGPGKPDYYLANYGDVVCVCNMDSALLDLPVASPKKFDERIYQANTKRIPKEGTAVTLILEVVPEKAKP
ncbi:MAG: YdjY domain-containing protein, partial [Gemmataceae bacterium]